MAHPAKSELPIPPQGRLESVPETSETIFNWDYETKRDSLLALY